MTIGPWAAMLMTRNSMLSMPGAPGRRNETIVLSMAALPMIGVSGMLRCRWRRTSMMMGYEVNATGD